MSTDAYRVAELRASRERLARAKKAFETGHFRQVRALCAVLISSGDEEVSAEARSLLRRIESDPVQVAVFVACLVVLGVIAYASILR